MRITSITPMKNEAPFLLEWVAYHRLIGVNDILVFTNHCTDGTDLMLERLDEMGLVRHYPNPSVYQDETNHHWHVIRYINTSQRLRRSDWVVSFDADEFIVVKPGQGLLSDLFAAVPEANVISMSQRNFGSSGIETLTDDLQIGQFTKAWATEGAYHPRIDRRGTKTLTHRSAAPRRWNNHSPLWDEARPGHVRIVNGSGTPLVDVNLRRQIKSLTAPQYGFDLVQLNHYPLRSLEAFVLKRDRGNANHDDRSADYRYWERYDHNTVQDDTVTRLQGDVEAARAELLKDPELSDLHAKAMAAARAKIAQLQETPAIQKLVKRIKEREALRKAS